MRVRPIVLLAICLVTGLAMVVIEGLAWARASLVRGWIQQLQAAYGFQPVPWWGMADSHIHLTASALATLWCGCCCRLFAPRACLWLPPLVVASACAADEFLQLTSAERAFQWSDLAAEGTGILLAWPLLLLLSRLVLLRGPDHRATATSIANRARSKAD